MFADCLSDNEEEEDETRQNEDPNILTRSSPIVSK